MPAHLVPSSPSGKTCLMSLRPEAERFFAGPYYLCLAKNAMQKLNEPRPNSVRAQFGGHFRPNVECSRNCIGENV
jgi:hypothetical protein